MAKMMTMKSRATVRKTPNTRPRDVNTVTPEVSMRAMMESPTADGRPKPVTRD